jgi:hypothetical protein
MFLFGDFRKVIFFVKNVRTDAWCGTDGLIPVMRMARDDGHGMVPMRSHDSRLVIGKLHPAIRVGHRLVDADEIVDGKMRTIIAYGCVFRSSVHVCHRCFVLLAAIKRWHDMSSRAHASHYCVETDRGVEGVDFADGLRVSVEHLIDV